MEKFVVESNIYEEAERMLLDIYCILLDRYQSNIEHRVAEFLTTKKYDRFFGNYSEIKTEDDIRIYKITMMLIIVGTSYKVALHNMVDDVEYEQSYEQLKDIEDLNPITIYQLFHEKNNETVLDYIYDYLEYSDNSYIYRNDCLTNVIKEGKIKNLLRVNPLEVLCYIDYMEPEEITDFERDLQNYIDIQAKAEISILREQEYFEIYELREQMEELVYEKYNGDQNKINNFYGYIFGNIYENLKIYKNLSDAHPGLLKYFEQDDIGFNAVMERYNTDDKFFEKIYMIFLEMNVSIEDGLLASNRENLKEKGGYGILKKFNPYYEEEDIVFKKYVYTTNM